MERCDKTPLKRRALHAGVHIGCNALSAALLLALAMPTALAQSMSLGDQLDAQLGLGDPSGCVDFLRITDADIVDAGDSQRAVNTRLNRLDDLDQIGDGLHAICGPSAVGSASSLGGGLNSVQATKTVSQFRLVRRRIDQRLPRRPRTVQESPLMLLLQPARLQSDEELRRQAPAGVAVFGDVEYERQDRETTRYEDGYEADIAGGTIGIDYAWDRAVVGAWGGYRRMDGDFRGGFERFLSDPAQLAAVCGGVLPGGDFDLDGGRFGGFAGWRLGDAGFIDINASRSRRDYRYDRNTCMIEVTAQPLSYVNGQLFGGGLPIDDIYAGRISGDTDITETGFSIRAGFDNNRGAWTFGPRATLGYSRTTIDAYSESGRSTVDNPVTPNNPVNPADPNPPLPDQGRIINRALGDPIGLELAYREQKHDSLLLELGGLVERRFETSRGMLVAHASAYWRHEFKDEPRVATVRFVQDLRPDPVFFSFVNGQVDADTALFSVGLTAVFNERAAMRFEVTHLAFDSYLDSTGVSAQVRVGL